MYACPYGTEVHVWHVCMYACPYGTYACTHAPMVRMHVRMPIWYGSACMARMHVRMPLWHVCMYACPYGTYACTHAPMVRMHVRMPLWHICMYACPYGTEVHALLKQARPLHMPCKACLSMPLVGQNLQHRALITPPCPCRSPTPSKAPAPASLHPTKGGAQSHALRTTLQPPPGLNKWPRADALCDAAATARAAAAQRFGCGEEATGPMQQGC